MRNLKIRERGSTSYQKLEFFFFFSKNFVQGTNRISSSRASMKYHGSRSNW